MLHLYLFSSRPTPSLTTVDLSPLAFRCKWSTPESSYLWKMAATKVAAFSVCLLVLFAMVAQSHAATCRTSSLFTCLNYVQGANPPAPSAACCAVVKAADKNCMCNQLKSSTFPAQMVHNGLLLPKKCGRKDLAGFKCGRFIFPQ